MKKRCMSFRIDEKLAKEFLIACKTHDTTATAELLYFIRMYIVEKNLSKKQS